MKSLGLYAAIAVVVLVAAFQLIDAKPSCFCMDFGRFCLRRCVTDKCANACHGRKMACYRKCAHGKREEMAQAADEEYLADLSEYYQDDGL